MRKQRFVLLATILVLCLCGSALANTNIGNENLKANQAKITAAIPDLGGCAINHNVAATNTGQIMNQIPAVSGEFINTATTAITASQANNLARHRWWDQATASSYLTQHWTTAYNGNWRHNNSACRAEAATPTWMNNLTLAGLGSPPNASNTSTAAMPANLSQNSNFA